MQLLNEHLTGEGASRKSEWVSLLQGTLEAFKTLKKVCMTAPILAFPDYTKPFLLETDASTDRLEAVLSQKQMDGQYHPIAYGSRALTSHEKNYHSTKLEILALKWAVTEHFKEYLPYQPFLVRTDNNPLNLHNDKHLTSMPLVTNGLEPLSGSISSWRTKKNGTTLWQMY